VRASPLARAPPRRRPPPPRRRGLRRRRRRPAAGRRRRAGRGVPALLRPARARVHPRQRRAVRHGRPPGPLRRAHWSRHRRAVPRAGCWSRRPRSSRSSSRSSRASRASTSARNRSRPVPTTRSAPSRARSSGCAASRRRPSRTGPPSRWPTSSGPPARAAAVRSASTTRSLDSRATMRLSSADGAAPARRRGLLGGLARVAAVVEAATEPEAQHQDPADHECTETCHSRTVHPCPRRLPGERGPRRQRYR
jgi:hypothetical protein